MTFKMTGKSRTITVYNYRADTCEFIGKGDALIPPFTGLPACCTSEKPPETSAGCIPVYDTESGRWNITEDHRGEVVYDTETGHQMEITEPGKYPTGTTTAAPENPWQKWNGKAWIDDADAERNALTESAKNNKSMLLKQANTAVATLQDAVDLEMATEDEKAQLAAWRKYRVLLSRIQPENAPDIEWPPLPV
ncbi:tail fiber assembly protein [Escherichia coli]|uniref:tail fiber assembly protein n=1 Tax=Escherichia coli TaxID=562 RepID=UPI000DD8FBAB|nr:tail fiber assembly protein [Escherichia coli]EEW8735254.1 tail fiber assembly protein [Escherichia coli]EFO3606030.1 tail fiber assembly protein [Escherichia coli]EFT2863786.1 tail fiber assembly protein [Escherichia coli]EFT3131586.1 tail fiber assembly protein [Escherichia coli]EGC2476354.1 tail fiber assembly protein [Escherichia coli]